MHFFRKIKEQRQKSKDKRNLPPNPLKGEFTSSMEDFYYRKTNERFNQSTDEQIN